MAYEETLQNVSLAADASIAVYTNVAGIPGTPSGTGSAGPAGFIYRFVKPTGKSQVGLVTANGDQAIGVLQSKPQVTGQSATVARAGISMVVSAGNTILAGDLITSDNAGRASKAGTIGATQNLATSATFAKSGNTVTVTSAAVHGLVVGDIVTIALATTAGNNGTFVIQTVPTTTTFTITAANGATEAVATPATVTKFTPAGRVFGVSLQASSTAGELIPVLLKF